MNYTTSGEIARAFDHQPWTRQAACHGLTTLFFPRRNESGAQRDAREAQAVAICATCPVRPQCELQQADEAVYGGVWGGKTPGATLAPIAHGTEKGYRQHYRRDETPCDPCREAYNAAQVGRRVGRVRYKPRPPQPRTPQPIEHGTDRGYQAHRRLQTEPCDACRMARADYIKAFRLARKGVAA